MGVVVRQPTITADFDFSKVVIAYLRFCRFECCQEKFVAGIYPQLIFFDLCSAPLMFSFFIFSLFVVQSKAARHANAKEKVTPPVGDARYAAVLQTPPAHVGLMGLLLPWNGNGLTTKMSKSLFVHLFVFVPELCGVCCSSAKL